MVFGNENIKKGPKITAELLNNADYDGTCFDHSVSAVMASGHVVVLKNTHPTDTFVHTEHILSFEGEEAHREIKLMTDHFKTEDI